MVFAFLPCGFLMEILGFEFRLLLRVLRATESKLLLNLSVQKLIA